MIIHLFFTFIFCIITLLNATNTPIKIVENTLSKTSPQKNSEPNPAKKITTKTHIPFKVINAITRKDLGYYKMLSWHYPDIFTLKVNDKVIAEGKSIEFTDPVLVIRYDYEWTTPWGKQIGAKEVTFEIPAEVTELSVTFTDWKEEERIAITNAKKISEEKLIAS